MPEWRQKNYKLDQELADYIYEHYRGMKPRQVCELVERRFEIVLSRSTVRELLSGRSWRPPRIKARELMKLAEQNTVKSNHRR